MLDYNVAINALNTVRSYVLVKDSNYLVDYYMYNQYYGKDELINMRCMIHDDYCCEIEDIIDYIDRLIEELKKRDDFVERRNRELYEKYKNKDDDDES